MRLWLDRVHAVQNVEVSAGESSVQRTIDVYPLQFGRRRRRAQLLEFQHNTAKFALRVTRLSKTCVDPGSESFKLRRQIMRLLGLYSLSFSRLDVSRSRNSAPRFIDGRLEPIFNLLVELYRIGN